MSTKYPVNLEKYTTRTELHRKSVKTSQLLSDSLFPNILLVAFICFDYITLYGALNLIFSETPFTLFVLTAAMAVSLDLPLAVAGGSLKAHHQNLIERRECLLTVGGAVLAFLVAYIPYAVLRVASREVTLNLDTGGTLIDQTAIENATTTDSPTATIVLIGSLLTAALPIATSIASFVFTYRSSDPLAAKKKKAVEAKLECEAHMIEVEQAIAEGETDLPFHIDDLVAGEHDRYQHFLRSIEADSVELKQLARTLVLMKLNNSDAVTNVTENAESVNRAHPVNVVPADSITSRI